MRSGNNKIMAQKILPPEGGSDPPGRSDPEVEGRWKLLDRLPNEAARQGLRGWLAHGMPLTWSFLLFSNHGCRFHIFTLFFRPSRLSYGGGDSNPARKRGCCGWLFGALDCASNQLTQTRWLALCASLLPYLTDYYAASLLLCRFGAFRLP